MPEEDKNWWDRTGAGVAVEDSGLLENGWKIDALSGDRIASRCLNPKGREPVRRNRRAKPFSVMAFKSLHDFNLETFATEVLLTLASVTTGQSFGYFICVNFARVIFRLSYFYAIAADRRTRVQHLFPNQNLRF